MTNGNRLVFILCAVFGVIMLTGNWVSPGYERAYPIVWSAFTAFMVLIALAPWRLSK